MPDYAPTPNWVAIENLAGQFAKNLATLATRDPALADTLRSLTPAKAYHLTTAGNQLLIGVTEGLCIRQLPVGVTAEQARGALSGLFPTADYTQSVVAAGLAQGWLWEAIYKLNTAIPTCPGLKLPIYLLAPDVEKLWVVLHFQNWSAMLADPRVMLVAGPDSADRLRAMLLANPMLRVPQVGLTVEPATWAGFGNFDAWLRSVLLDVEIKHHALREETASLVANLAPAEAGRRLLDDRPLRVLGVTSRYTTFLRHSMGDWLAAFESLGHSTRLVMEQTGYEVSTPLAQTQACAEFRPDLIVLIDHYRKELTGLPANVPCVMWVQDKMPSIYEEAAGLAQGRADFVIGYGRQQCMRRFGYPGDRFMPALVGVNDKRFVPREPTASERRRFGCDVSFVSHASATAEEVVAQEIANSKTPEASRLLTRLHEKLAAIYEAGGSVTEFALLKRIVVEGMAEVRVSTDALDPLMDFVVQRLNNALFRHQAIRWAAATGVDLRLYGRGWEKHPEFSRHARGVADNATELSAIYHCSKINLQVTPFGAAHQRTLDGVMSGAFVLMRHTTGESAERIYQQFWQRCVAERINSAEEFIARASIEARRLLADACALTGERFEDDPDQYFMGISEAADLGFTRCASTLWPDYDRVAFTSADEVSTKIRHFLANPEERRQIALAMRARLLDTHTYEAITRRMLRFMGENLSAVAAPVPTARAA